MSEQSFRNAWGAIDRSDDPAQFIQFMDTVGQERPADPKHYEHLLSGLQVVAGQRVLEVGCGRGGAVRAMGHIVGPTGQAVGVDNSAVMIAEARRRALGLNLPVEYRVGDVYRLPFANATFDSCYTDGLFEILQDPLQALREMKRVLRPGGRLLVIAPDYGMLAIDASDRELTRRLLSYFCDHEVNGWIGRELSRLYRESGLMEITVAPQTVVLTNYEIFQWLLMSSVWLGRAEAAGVVSATEVATWLADQDQRAQTGNFFVTTVNFMVIGHQGH